MGLNISLETTSVASNPVNKQLNQELREHNKLGLFVAAGPSSAFPVVGSEGAADAYPYLDDLSFPTIFPDLALGYHFTKADALVAVSRRRMVQRRSAYNRALDIDRQSTRPGSLQVCGGLPRIRALRRPRSGHRAHGPRRA